MKLIAQSTFHPFLRHTFVGLNEGPNFRRCPKLCDCECGYPLFHTELDYPDGYCVSLQWSECTDHGANLLEIFVERL